MAAELQRGDIELVGRTEAQVSAELGRRLRAEGHHRVNFAIVAAGANAASPHHEPGERVIREGEVVLCDFGGTMLGDDGIGYCSDITRCVHLGEPPDEMAEAYAVLLEAQQAAVAARRRRARRARRSTPPPAGSSPRPGGASSSSTAPATASASRSTRTPTSCRATARRSSPGHAFSIEPGIYVPGRFGFRLEDIVVAADDGPDPLNRADHDLALLVSPRRSR